MSEILICKDCKHAQAIGQSRISGWNGKEWVDVMTDGFCWSSPGVNGPIILNQTPIENLRMQGLNFKVDQYINNPQDSCFTPKQEGQG